MHHETQQKQCSFACAVWSCAICARIALRYLACPLDQSPHSKQHWRPMWVFFVLVLLLIWNGVRSRFLPQTARLHVISALQRTAPTKNPAKKPPIIANISGYMQRRRNRVSSVRRQLDRLMPCRVCAMRASALNTRKYVRLRVGVISGQQATCLCWRIFGQTSSVKDQVRKLRMSFGVYVECQSAIETYGDLKLTIMT